MIDEMIEKYPFVKGDKVICVESDFYNRIKVGETYTVEKAAPFAQIQIEENKSGMFFRDRFRLSNLNA